MVNAKINVFKALTLCIGVVMLLYWSFPVCAADEVQEGQEIYQLTFPYSHAWPYYDMQLDIVSDVPVYFYIDDENIVNWMIAEDGLAEVDILCLNSDGSIGSSASSTMTAAYTTMKSNMVGFAFAIDNLTDYTDNVLMFNSYDAVLKFIEDGDDSGLLFGDIDSEVVEWYEFDYNAAYYIKNFNAVQTTTELKGAWEDVCFTSRRGDSSIETGFIRLKYCIAGSDGGRFSGGVRYYPNVFQVTDKQFTLSLTEDIVLPEGSYISYISVTPYVYVGESQFRYFKGKTTVLYFDESLIVTSVDTIVPDTEYDEEVPEWSIWNSVSNFFADFWNNLLDALYDLFIPETDVLLSHFNNFNDLFSERLGFIWYPFDLAIQLVNALAGGEADSTFIVPGYSLDVQGVSYVIWEPIEVDMDAVGIFEYVRFFTSTLLVCGTVRLAIKKWDEWIGGRTNGN